jgi:hypothetical protein
VLLIFSQGVMSSKVLEKLRVFLSRHRVYISVVVLAGGSFILIVSVTGDIVAAGTSSLVSLILAAIALRRLSVIGPAFWILYGVLLINAEPAQRVWQVENWNRWSHFKETRVEIRKTNSGLDLYTAQPGNMCEDAPIPCAQSFEPRLQAEISADGKFRMFWLSGK